MLKNMSDLSLETKLFNETLSMPVALAPVGCVACTPVAVKCRPLRRRMQRHPVYPLHRVCLPD